MAEEIVWGAGMDDADFQRGIKKMIQEIDRLKQKLKETSAESAKGARETKSGLDIQVGSLRDVVGQVNLVGIATSAVRQGYAMWMNEVHRVTEAHHGLHTTLVKTIAASRDLANAQQIETAIKGITGMSYSQATAAYGATQAAAPGLGYQKHIELAQGAAPLGPMGQDINAHVNIAAKLQQAMPSLSAGDANDLALVVRKRAGEDAPRYASDDTTSVIARLKAAGLTDEQAMSVTMADIEADLPSKNLKKISEALVARDPHAGKKHRTSKEKSESKMYQMNAQERFEAISKGGDAAEIFLGAGGALAMRTAGDLSEQRTAFRSIFGADLMAQERQQFNRWGTGNLATIEQENKARTEAMDDAQGGPWNRATAIRTRADVIARERGVGFFDRMAMNTELYARQQVGQLMGRDPTTDVVQGIREMPGQRHFFGDQIQELRKLAENMKALEEATKENTKAVRGEKAKGKNIDARIQN